MLSKDDLKKIEELVKKILIQGTWHLATKEDLKSLATNDQVSHLPTKDEFFTRMDKLSGEVKAMRESQELHAGQHKTINDRLHKIEQQIHIS